MVKNPQIAGTSGNADLDKAAVACLTGARIKPVKKAGNPIEVDSQVRVVWQRSYFSGAPTALTQNVCRAFYPPLAVRLHHEGITKLSFLIAENGMAKNVAIGESSGHEELDQASMACVSTFQYRPVTQNGRPIVIDWTAEIVWRLTN